MAEESYRREDCLVHHPLSSSDPPLDYLALSLLSSQEGRSGETKPAPILGLRMHPAQGEAGFRQQQKKPPRPTLKGSGDESSRATPHQHPWCPVRHSGMTPEIGDWVLADLRMVHTGDSLGVEGPWPVEAPDGGLPSEDGGRLLLTGEGTGVLL